MGVQKGVGGDEWRSGHFQSDQSIEVTRRPTVEVGNLGRLLVTEPTPATEVGGEHFASRADTGRWQWGWGKGGRELPKGIGHPVELVSSPWLDRLPAIDVLEGHRHPSTLVI